MVTRTTAKAVVLFLKSMRHIHFFFHILILLFFAIGCDNDDDATKFELTGVFVGSTELNPSSQTSNIPVEQSIVLVFSSPVDINSVEAGVQLMNATQVVDVNYTFLDNNKTISLSPKSLLNSNTEYSLTITSSLKGAGGKTISPRQYNFKTVTAALQITDFTIDNQNATGSGRITNVPLTSEVAITFSVPLDPASIVNNVSFSGPISTTFTTTLVNDNKTLIITNTGLFKDLSRYTIKLTNQVKGINDEAFGGLSRMFYTGKSLEPKLPIISDEQLLTLVQQQTFKYFWDFAHPASGMARERNTSGDLVTSGGSGFGIMALIVGMERGFITREEGLQRMTKILTFLENADRFHGAWSHWINGNNGDVIPFSANDNGGDLVETSFLVQGLLAFRQYLQPGVTAEKTLIDRINVLWKAVEWNWYTKDGEDVLYWHWSPDKNWVMNHQIRGHNETLITYVLAASSPDHSIAASVYHNGYARGGDIKNGDPYYGISLPLGDQYGGPLFFAHYSFLGLDPRNLTDTYANYWTQNVNHTLINQKHAVNNPKAWVGYSEENWGFTASDNQSGYSAHSPTNDLGVITPTAALSSFPYAPDESMKALKFFYYTLGDRLWKEYGFVDAFNLTDDWVASSFLAIDQGPIIVMIENYRTGLLWELFMSAPEVKVGLDKLGFTY